MWFSLRRWRLLLGVLCALAALIFSVCEIYDFFKPSAPSAKRGWVVEARFEPGGFWVVVQPLPAILASKKGLPDWFIDELAAARKDPPAKRDTIPLPRPRPDMWQNHYLAWVGRRSSNVGDGEGPRFTKEWRRCDVPTPHPICGKPIAYRMNPANYPIELDGLRDK